MASNSSVAVQSSSRLVSANALLTEFVLSLLCVPDSVYIIEGQLSFTFLSRVSVLYKEFAALDSPKREMNI